MTVVLHIVVIMMAGVSTIITITTYKLQIDDGGHRYKDNENKNKDNDNNNKNISNDNTLCWGTYPDNNIHGDNVGPTWGRQDPGAPCWPHEPGYLGSDAYWDILPIACSITGLMSSYIQVVIGTELE